jgi:hypothetical protein
LFEADAKVTIKDSGATYEIDYSFGDLNNLYPAVRSTISGNRASWAKDYGTPLLHDEDAALIAGSRDKLRGTDYPDPPPNSRLAIHDGCDVNAGITNILSGESGVCVGHGHSDPAAFTSLGNMANEPDKFGLRDGMLFIEELPAVLQPEIDRYLAIKPPNNPPANFWSEAANTFFKSQVGPRNLKDDSKFEEIIENARKNNIKVFAIDSGDLSPPMDGDHPSYGEMRDANMNAFGANVIRKAIAQNPGSKYVVFCGGKHSNTHEGGIPGFSQLLNIPAVRLESDDGKMYRDDEGTDPSLRVMPSREEQAFIDGYLSRLETDLPGRNISDLSEAPRPDSRKALAVEMAARLRAAGKLPIMYGRTDAAHAADNLLADQKMREIISSMPVRNSGRFQAAQTAIRTGNIQKLETLLQADPGLALMRTDKGENLLAIARGGSVAATADAAAALVRTAMVVRVKSPSSDGRTLTNEDVAEAVVTNAEYTAWYKTTPAPAPGGAPPNPPLDVNPKKHRDLVAKMAAKLAGSGKSADRAGANIDALSQALVDDNSFYTKDDTLFRKRDPDHVSIDKKKANKVWVAQLAALGAGP